VPDAAVPERAGPLAGRHIAVTRPREQAEYLAAGLERLGASVALVPLVEIAPVEDSTELDHAVRKLGRYDWIVFTSTNGVAAVRERLRAPDQLATVRIAAVGPATAAAVEGLGIETAFVPEEYAGGPLADGLTALDGRRVLLPQGDRASTFLAEELRDQGAIVDAVVAYRTVARRPSGQEVEELERADAIVLASGSAARSLASLATDFDGIRKRLLVCIGPRTAAVVGEVSLTPGLVADEASADGIIQALTTHFGGSP
jgi:uroporphyrinogen III methyltransferase/synthase